VRAVLSDPVRGVPSNGNEGMRVLKKPVHEGAWQCAERSATCPVPSSGGMQARRLGEVTQSGVRVLA